MRVVAIQSPGGPEQLQLAQAETPQPGAGEVLIKVAAAGINRPDVVQRQGFYPPPPGASPIPGLEVAGTIVALGDGVSQWQLDQPVCALLAGGGYAEYAVAPAAQCLPVPAGWSMAQAAALPETYFTVWSNVFDRARLQAGEVFLTHGGSGGIGLTAIQLANAFGARTFATAGSAEKCRMCESLGAEKALDYNQCDFVEELQAVTGGRGVDVILDMVGGDYINRNIKLAAEDGRIVSIGFLQGAKVDVNFMPVMLKRLQLTGSTLRPRPVAFKAAIADQLRHKVWPLLENGQLKSLPVHTLGLADAAQAHALMEANAHIGKLVLVT